MSCRLRRFSGDESGAVTADYVMLAGAILALGLSAVNAIRMGTFEGSKNISEAVRTQGCVVTGATGTTDLTNCD